MRLGLIRKPEETGAEVEGGTGVEVFDWRGGCVGAERLREEGGGASVGDFGGSECKRK